MSKIIDGRYQYFAFISYNREDERWAKWLQHKQEHYKLPSNLNGQIFHTRHKDSIQRYLRAIPRQPARADTPCP